MKYRIRVLKRAQFDVDYIVHWMAVERESPQGAAAWLTAYESALARLEVNPLGYGSAPESEHVEEDLRQFLFKTRRGRTYRGVFVVVEDEVRVLRVRGPGQAPLGPDELGE